jgi:hypothetical protein
MGASWRFEEVLNNSEDSSTLNTSFIERLNLTIRQGSAYLTRRTLSHARSEDMLEAHLELLRCHYNFVRPHGALKFGRETRTPAMQAGLPTWRFTLREVFVCRPLSLLIEIDPMMFAGSNASVVVRPGTRGQMQLSSASGQDSSTSVSPNHREEPNLYRLPSQ